MFNLYIGFLDMYSDEMEISGKNYSRLEVPMSVVSKHNYVNKSTCSMIYGDRLSPTNIYGVFNKMTGGDLLIHEICSIVAPHDEFTILEGELQLDLSGFSNKIRNLFLGDPHA